MKSSLWDEVQAVTTEATAPTKATKNPPPGVEDHGVWGSVRYVGQTTKIIACFACLAFCLPGLCVLLCPMDEKDGYQVKGMVSAS